MEPQFTESRCPEGGDTKDACPDACPDACTDNACADAACPGSACREDPCGEPAPAHTPVLLRESIHFLQPGQLRDDAVIVDGTLGRAGHSRAILRELPPGGRLIGIDRDWTALEEARQRLAPWQDRVTLLHGNFADLPQLLAQAGVPAADGMLFDLGVSSPQLDDGSRGFSYQKDAPLDMRMDTQSPLTAREIVNSWSEDELRRILRAYGEERYASRIARAIVRAREKAPIETTLELVDIIRSAMPAAALREKQHPARRSFQALRIATNGELDALQSMLTAAADLLRPGGRLAVITFHSLEDRMVKQTLRELARGCTCPPEFPVCVCGKRPKLRPVTRKPVVPGAAELAANPRSRSARLRVAERLPEPA